MQGVIYSVLPDLGKFCSLNLATLHSLKLLRRDQAEIHTALLHS